MQGFGRFSNGVSGRWGIEEDLELGWGLGDRGAV
jgi:hypothetical protein